MITKKNLWFLTLFSIILVMAVYYVSTPENTLLTTVSKEINTDGKDASVNVSESSQITALKVSRDETLEKEVNSIKEILTSTSKTTEEKNNAYEALKNLNVNKGKEESLEALIKKNTGFDCYVEIDATNIKVVVDTKNHSYDLANKIIKMVQNEFDKKVYTTVSFGSM